MFFLVEYPNFPESGTRSEIKPTINFVYRAARNLFVLCIVYLSRSLFPDAPLVDHFNKPRFHSVEQRRNHISAGGASVARAARIFNKPNLR